jgi:hypothetical protein
MNKWMSILKCMDVILVWALISCNAPEPASDAIEKKESVPTYQARGPLFNGDSAYAYVKAQCDFGPRVPNTKAHDQCGNYLEKRLKSLCSIVHVQQATVKAYNGADLKIKNLIAQFNEAATVRILLFAHWDTRPWADQDSERRDEPILGADDGASGVGVLLELARILNENAPPLGIDIAFFDAEDYGTKSGEEQMSDSYALGTQYWCRNLMPQGYKARYGILLDMVGASNATFIHEEISNKNAGELLTFVWDKAAKLGYAKYFVWQQGPGIDDDHKYTNELLGLPSIDIIHLNTHSSARSVFPNHWHTHRDNMDIIDPTTLKAVGQTLTECIWTLELK